MKLPQKKVLTTKKLQAILSSKNKHLIGVEFKTNLDITLGALTQVHPVIENARVEEGAFVGTLVLNSVLKDKDDYRDTLLEQMAVVFGLNTLARAETMSMKVDALNPSITTVIEVDPYIGESAWVREYTMLGVAIAEVFLKEVKGESEYYVRLLFSSEDNLRPLSSFINKKLDSRSLTWLLENLETGIFGSYVEMIDVELQSLKNLFMIPVHPTPYGLGFHTLYDLDNKEKVTGISTGGISSEDLPIVHSAISIDGYSSELLESNGVYNLSLTKEYKDSADHISVFIR